MSEQEMSLSKKLAKRMVDIKKKKLLQSKFDAAAAQSRARITEQRGISPETLDSQLRLADIYLGSLRSTISALGGELKITADFSGEVIVLEKLSQ